MSFIARVAIVVDEYDPAIDFDASYARMRAAGVEFVGSPRTEPYGRVAVFVDVVRNRWDLLGPAPT